MLGRLTIFSSDYFGYSFRNASSDCINSANNAIIDVSNHSNPSLCSFFDCFVVRMLLDFLSLFRFFKFFTHIRCYFFAEPKKIANLLRGEV